MWFFDCLLAVVKHRVILLMVIVLVLVMETWLHLVGLRYWWCDPDIRRQRLIEWTLMHYDSSGGDVPQNIATEVDMA